MQLQYFSCRTQTGSKAKVSFCLSESSDTEQDLMFSSTLHPKTENNIGEEVALNHVLLLLL